MSNSAGLTGSLGESMIFTGRARLWPIVRIAAVCSALYSPLCSPFVARVNAQTAAEESALSDEELHRERAASQLHEEEQQRILGVVPNFNTSNIQNAEPLSSSQKLGLALKTVTDPFTFVAAGLDAGFSQAENNFGAYGQGLGGYSQRFSASYADSFSGAMLGNAVLPILFRQDPRYFRKATGSFTSRLAYAVTSTVRCKSDSGEWVPNYSNVLGNVAAGSLSNLYYPASDRGLGLTLERAFVVTAEGTMGAVFVEFWPDISRRIFPKHHRDELASSGDGAK